MTLQEQLDQAQSDLRVEVGVTRELKAENRELKKKVKGLERMNTAIRVQGKLKTTKESPSEPVVKTEPQVKKPEPKTVTPVVVAKKPTFDLAAFNKDQKERKAKTEAEEARKETEKSNALMAYAKKYAKTIR